MLNLSICTTGDINNTGGLILESFSLAQISKKGVNRNPEHYLPKENTSGS